jgi:hypothetical protein
MEKRAEAAGQDQEAVERCHAIDTADLRRSELLAPGTRTGSFKWGGTCSESSVNFTLIVEENTASLHVAYEVMRTGEQLCYAIRLITGPCQFGGKRWWFLCPLAAEGKACSRRVRKLYLAGRYFGCRQCHSLTYRSTQESDGRVYAALRGERELGSAKGFQNMLISQLGFALKVLTSERKRLDRLGKRLNRHRDHRQARRNEP